jgi:hypothetical protein
VTAASNRCPTTSKLACGPFQRNSSTSSNSAMLVRRVASVRNRHARSRSSGSVWARIPALATFTCHSRHFAGMGGGTWPERQPTTLVPSLATQGSHRPHRRQGPSSRELMARMLDVCPHQFTRRATCLSGNAEAPISVSPVAPCRKRHRLASNGSIEVTRRSARFQPEVSSRHFR